MKKKFILFILFTLVLVSACGQAASSPGPVIGRVSTPPGVLPATETPTSAPLPSATPTNPIVGYGPSGFPANVDPLTGLIVANPALLERRPLAIKVENLPREHRPQFGLSLADIVFEYYTEAGSTRFIALFYGKDASIVGPIRSARFFDLNVVRGYKAVFAFGYAYVAELQRLYSSEFANRLVVEGGDSPLTRYDPNGADLLVVNTADLSAYITKQGVENGRQDLDGMTFKTDVPSGGQAVNQVYFRYSSAIYNRWDYDPATGTYLRYSDTVDDLTGGQGEQYAQLTDRLTKQPIAFDNVVVLYVTYQLYATNIYDVLFSGSGKGYAFRDGQAYPVNWLRNDTDVVSLTNPDGSPFAFKPGTTWFEVVGLKTTLNQTDQFWRFTHNMP